MDRDKRWERVQKAYDVMCRDPGECETVPPGGVKALVEAKYANMHPMHVYTCASSCVWHVHGMCRYALAEPEKDEFILPTGTLADGGLADGDVFVCFNFRCRACSSMHPRACTRTCASR